MVGGFSVGRQEFLNIWVKINDCVKQTIGCLEKAFCPLRVGRMPLSR